MTLTPDAAPTRGPRELALLCGGFNRRLDVLSGTVYKPFLPIRGLSLVARHIMRATLAGVTEVTVVVDSADPLVTSYVEAINIEAGGTCNVRLLTVRGTAAAKIVAYHRQRDRELPLVMALGDTYAHYDPRELTRRPLALGVDSAITVGLFRLPFGVVEANEGVVSRFAEKPETSYLINLGQLALGPAALELLERGEEVDAMLVQLAEKQQLAAIELDSEFVTIDSIGDIASAFESSFLFNGDQLKVREESNLSV